MQRSILHQSKQTLLLCYCTHAYLGCFYVYIVNNTDNLSELSFGTSLLILLFFSLIFSIRYISYFPLNFVYVMHECELYLIVESKSYHSFPSNTLIKFSKIHFKNVLFNFRTYRPILANDYLVLDW